MCPISPAWTATTSNPVLSSVLNETNQSCLTLCLSLAPVYRLKDIPGIQSSVHSVSFSFCLKLSHLPQLSVPSSQVAQYVEQKWLVASRYLLKNLFWLKCMAPIEFICTFTSISWVVFFLHMWGATYLVKRP